MNMCVCYRFYSAPPRTASYHECINRTPVGMFQKPFACPTLLIWSFLIHIRSRVCTGCFILKMDRMLYAVPVSLISCQHDLLCAEPKAAVPRLICY